MNDMEDHLEMGSSYFPPQLSPAKRSASRSRGRGSWRGKRRIGHSGRTVRGFKRKSGSISRSPIKKKVLSSQPTNKRIVSSGHSWMKSAPSSSYPRTTTLIAQGPLRSSRGKLF